MASSHLSSFVLVTQELLKVAKEMQSCASIALTGPKGCGKSFIVTILFIILQNKKACLYFGPTSFDNPCSRDYFLNFLNCHKAKISDYEKLHKLLLSCENKCLPAVVVKLIQSDVKTIELFLFVDFGNLNSYEDRSMVLDGLINCVSICSFGKLSIVIALSCGISVMKI